MALRATAKLTPDQALDEAKTLARRKGCFVFRKIGVGYMCYREAQPKNLFAGKSKTETGILRIVKNLIDILS